jgi:uncharacterized protein with beta-barrel porin domain
MGANLEKSCLGNQRSLGILLSLCLGFFSSPLAFAQDYYFNDDHTDTIELGFGSYSLVGTAWIMPGVTIGPSAILQGYAIEASGVGWIVDNSGIVIADYLDADSIHFYDAGTVINRGTIDSELGQGVGAELSLPTTTAMTLTNESAGLIEGFGSGVYFDLFGSTVSTNSIDNDGTIVGGSSGVFVKRGDTTLINTGSIEGLAAEGVILGGPGDSNNYTLINSGTIIGNDPGFWQLTISMGGGDDTVQLETGSQIINGNIDGDVGTDALKLHGSGVVDWNNYNFEELYKDWSGLWELETDLSLGGTSKSQILDGELRLDNITLTSSSFQLNLPGTLSGNGAIDGSIINNGTISLGGGTAGPLGTLDLSGNVTFAAGSTMAVDIGAQGTGDLLKVTGSTTIAGTTDTIWVNEFTAIAGGEVVNVITADSLDTSFGSLEYRQGDPLVVTFSQSITPTSLGILTTRLPYSDFAATDNQWQVADALYDSVGLSTGDLGRVLAHLDFLPPQDLQNAFEELQPKPYATHPGLILRDADLVRSNLTERLRDRREEPIGFSGDNRSKNSNSYEIPGSSVPNLLDYKADVSQPVSLSGEQSKWRIYAQSYIQWTEEKTDTSIDRSEAFTFGAFFGTDGRLSQRLIGGLCLGTGVTEMENSGGSGDKLSLRFGPYFSYFRDRFILEGSVTGSVNWLSNQRSIDITGLSRSAQGSYDSYDLAAELAALYELNFWGFTLEPELRVAYDYMYLDDFQETGADSISLIVFDRQLHSLNHRIGGRFGYEIKFSNSFLRPEAWVAWAHTYLNDEQAVQAAFAGAPQNDFTISAPKTQRDILHWGAGMTLSLAGAVNCYLRYQAEVYPDTWNHSAQGGFRFQL